MELSPLHERIHAVVAGKTFRVVAEMTGANAETVRRYLSGQDPNVEFLAALCKAAGINGEWLLTGRGPMRKDAVTPHALQEASVSELLNAMAKMLERLATRVDRLEQYTQTLETRLRAAENPLLNPELHAPARPTPHAVASGVASHDRQKAAPKRQAPAGDQQASQPADIPQNPQGTPEVVLRAQRLADALAQRPRPNAD